MQQIYTIWKDDNGTLVMLGAEGKPVVAGPTLEITSHLILKHPNKPPAPMVSPMVAAGGGIQVNKQTPADPVVPRPHAVSGAAG